MKSELPVYNKVRRLFQRPSDYVTMKTKATLSLTAAEKSKPKGLPVKTSDSPYIYPQVSLMGIPREIRLQILGYVLPDRMYMPIRRGEQCRYSRARIKDYRRYLEKSSDEKDKMQRKAGYKDIMNGGVADKNGFRRFYIPIRYDLDRSLTCIMRVNKQLSEEGVYALYLNKTFEAKLDRALFYLAGKVFPLNITSEFGLKPIAECDADLKFQLRYMSSLYIKIPEEIHSGKSMDDNRWSTWDQPVSYVRKTTRDSLEHLIEILATSKTLRHLVIDFRGWPAKEGDDEFPKMTAKQKIYHWLLQPFDKLRGLSSVCFRLSTVYNKDDSVDEEDYVARRRQGIPDPMMMQPTEFGGFLRSLSSRMCGDGPSTWDCI